MKQDIEEYRRDVIEIQIYTLQNTIDLLNQVLDEFEEKLDSLPKKETDD